MTLEQRITMFWYESADKNLLPWLDKHDLIQLSLLNKHWYGVVNSRYLFSTIVTCIKEVVQNQAKKDNLITPDQK